MNNFKNAILAVAISMTISPLCAQYTSGIIFYKSEVNAELKSGDHTIKNEIKVAITLEFLNEAYRLTMTSMKGGFMTISDADLQSQYQIYDPERNMLFRVTNYSNSEYLDAGKVQLDNVRLLDESMEIQGISCKKFECVFRGIPAIGYYSPELPATISTMGNLGLPGALMAFESESTKIWVEAIDLNYQVDKSRVTLK